METLDSFIIGLSSSCKYFGKNIPKWFLYGSSGFGSRITLTMNVKTGKEIGHPSSNYIWDIVSFAQQCLENTGINWNLFIGDGYFTDARLTAVQRLNSYSKINLIRPEEMEGILIQGPYVTAHPDGSWIYGDNFKDQNHPDYEIMPFGPVVFKITDVTEKQMNFPYSTLIYLINTLERGEEPMETIGIGNYSAVSGWKAYARWIQAYTVPLKGIRHDHLKNLAPIIRERRSEFAVYWRNLSSELNNKVEITFAENLAKAYQNLIPFLDNIIESGETIETIRDLYFEEQKILPIYKRIGNHIKNSRIIR